MTWPLFIARRYLVSKKSSSMISAISLISLMGVAVASAAMVIVLSVFNGFQDLVASFFTAFDPQLKVVPVSGKTLAADDSLLLRLRSLPEVSVASDCFEERALAVYADKQAIVHIKGVDDSFAQESGIRSILMGDGDFSLHAADLNFAVPGILLAYKMGMPLHFQDFLYIYAPRREGLLDMSNPTDGFLVDSLYSSGQVFQVSQPKYDENYLLAPLQFVRSLFDAEGQVTSLELRLKPGTNLRALKRQMRKMGEGRVQVLDRYEQQSETFNIMNIEKLLAYLFLTFILMVACFNLVSTLSMLIIDKRGDVQTLRSLGATDRHISSIFLFQGRLIAVVGALIGIGIGLLLCWLQQQYGLVRLGTADGQFIVDAYPVSVHLLDVLVVFFTVVLVGWVAVWYPVRYFSKRLLGNA